MATVEDRLGRLEGQFAHLATKTDLANLETKLTHEMAKHLRWMIGLQLASLAILVAAASAFLQLAA